MGGAEKMERYWTIESGKFDNRNEVVDDQRQDCHKRWGGDGRRV